MLGFHAAVTRCRPDNTPAGGWHPEEKLSPLEALRGYTRDAAVAAFREDELGSLLPGFLADLTVLEQDPVTADPSTVASIRVLGTVVGGVAVFAPADSPLFGTLPRPRVGAAAASPAALAAAAAWDRRFVEDTAEDSFQFRVPGEAWV